MSPDEALALQQQDDDLRTVLATPYGRRFFWRLVDGVGKLHAASYAGEATHQSAYLEGRRAVALELVQEAMRVAPAEYLHLVADALDAQRIRQEAAATRGHDGDRGHPSIDD